VMTKLWFDSCLVVLSSIILGRQQMLSCCTVGLVLPLQPDLKILGLVRFPSMGPTCLRQSTTKCPSWASWGETE
jgi:hypothetical protein